MTAEAVFFQDVFIENELNAAVGVVHQGEDRYAAGMNVEQTLHILLTAEGKACREEKGYRCFTGRWQPGDRVSLDFPMPVRALQGNPLLKETLGELCFSRGPLVYCAEEADNGKRLHLLRADPHAAVEVTPLKIADLTLPALRMPARRITADERAPLYADWQAPVTEPAELTLIPYFAWNNRGEGEMTVWMNVTEK